MGEHAMNETAGTRGTNAAGTTRWRGSASFWVGWIYFAGAMMMMAGGFSLIEGLVALLQNEYYVPSTQGLLVLDLTGWGWVHVVMGGLAIVIGFGLFVGAMWARVTGVVFALLNTLVQLAFMSAAPVWATIVIVIDILVIWALIVHGDEAKRRAEW